MRTAGGPTSFVALLAAVLFTPPGRSEVLSAQPAGFSMRARVSIAAEPSKVYRRLLQIGRWWNDAHTHSGAALNMKLEAKPGGCWLATGRTLRLDSALGPLHEAGGSGSLNLQLDPEGSGTRVTLTYVGTGFEPQKGLAAMAPLFDEVLGDAMQRLKRYVETGNTPAGR